MEVSDESNSRSRSKSLYVGMSREEQDVLFEFCATTVRQPQQVIRHVLKLFFAEYAADGGRTAEQRLLQDKWNIVEKDACAAACKPIAAAKPKEVAKS